MALGHVWSLLLIEFCFKTCFALKQINACERGVATQGPFTSDLRNAHMAIDGNTDQTSNYASVQDRKETGTAWWVVDLQYRRTIVNLTVLWANPDVKREYHKRTIKRRYGYAIYVSNVPDPISRHGSLCYRDDGRHKPALATVVIDNCTISSRFIHISNTRPSHITDASEWPNLEITEVVANIEIGGSVRTSFACHR